MGNKFAKGRPVVDKIGVYKISFVGSNRVYIGSSNYVGRRKSAHLSTLRRGVSGCCKLQLAFNKYGEEAMVFEVLEFCELSVLIEREQYYLDKYNAAKRGLNIGMATKAAMLGRKHTKAARNKISRAGMGNTYRLGSRQSKEQVEHRARLTSIALKGRPRYDLSGAKHPNAVFNDRQIRAMRGFYAAKMYTQVQLANMYNCHECTIGRIINYESYKHVRND